MDIVRRNDLMLLLENKNKLMMKSGLVYVVSWHLMFFKELNKCSIICLFQLFFEVDSEYCQDHAAYLLL